MKSRVVTPTFETSSARATFTAARRTSNATRTLIAEFLVRAAGIDLAEIRGDARRLGRDLLLNQQARDFEEMHELAVAEALGFVVQLTQTVPHTKESSGALLSRQRSPYTPSSNLRFDDDLEKAHSPTPSSCPKGKHSGAGRGRQPQFDALPLVRDRTEGQAGRVELRLGAQHDDLGRLDV